MKSCQRIDSSGLLEFKRISLRIFKIVNFKVDIRFRPVKMGTVKKLHILDLAHGLKDIFAAGDYEPKNLDSLLDALSRAKPGEVIFIPGGTIIDLTTLVYIEKLVLVTGGVTLAGNRGLKGTPGALLLSDTQNTPMIRVSGTDARITGLRIQGPNPKRRLDHHRRAFGSGGHGHEYYYRFPTQIGIQTSHDNLRVDNCDISGFGHAVIYIEKGKGHHIHHNLTHHCQYHGRGYGICLDQASALIEFNLFDWNRHSIAGTGRRGSSYAARNNVEMGSSSSHCFDMHGGSDREDGTNIAGTYIEISNNTFRPPQTPVLIRGVPEEKCEVPLNWFVKHGSPGQAVHHYGIRTHVFNNFYYDKSHGTIK